MNYGERNKISKHLLSSGEAAIGEDAASVQCLSQLYYNCPQGRQISALYLSRTLNIICCCSMENSMCIEMQFWHSDCQRSSQLLCSTTSHPSKVVSTDNQTEYESNQCRWIPKHFRLNAPQEWKEKAIVRSVFSVQFCIWIKISSQNAKVKLLVWIPIFQVCFFMLVKLSMAKLKDGSGSLQGLGDLLLSIPGISSHLEMRSSQSERWSSFWLLLTAYRSLKRAHFSTVVLILENEGKK